MHDIWIALIVVLFAAVVQGLAGFAFGMLSMACLTLIWDPQRANVIVTFLAMYSIAHTLWHVRQDVHWRTVALLVCGGLIGLPIGTQALVSPEMKDLLKILVALGCVWVAAQNWFADERRTQAGGRRETGLGFLAGIAGGFLSGAVSSAGPPTIWYIYRQPWERNRLKATTLGVFFVNGVFKLLYWGAHDLLNPTSALMTRDRCLTALILWPAVILGASLGCAAFGKVDRTQLRRIVCVLLLLMAALILMTLARQRLGG